MVVRIRLNLTLFVFFGLYNCGWWDAVLVLVLHWYCTVRITKLLLSWVSISPSSLLLLLLLFSEAYYILLYVPILNCSLSATYVIVKKMKVKRRRYVHALAPTAGIITDKDIKKQIILSHCTKVAFYFLDRKSVV